MTERTAKPLSISQVAPGVQLAPKLAIVGMDSFWGSCDGLDAFERSLYDGNQHFAPISPQQWQEIERQTEPLSRFAQTGAEPQDMLMLHVADRALGNLRSKRESPHQRLGVMISGIQKFPVQEFSQMVFQRWGAQKLAQISLITDVADASIGRLLNVAQEWLLAADVDAVLIGAVQLADKQALVQQAGGAEAGVTTLSYGVNAELSPAGEGAGAVVVKLLQSAIESGDRIYAVIDANYQIPLKNLAINDQVAIQQAAEQALHQAHLDPTDIGYMEVCASGILQEDEIETRGLLQAYQAAAADSASLSCAIGSVKATIGHTQAAAGIAGLIKTALCLYHRFLPATPHWLGMKSPQDWQESRFYVPTESRPWFLSTTNRRIAALSSIDLSGNYSHLVISEDPSQRNRRSRYLQQMSLYLLPIAAQVPSELSTQLDKLEQQILNGVSLRMVAEHTFTTYQASSNATDATTYALAILGRNRDEVLKEIQLARKGIVTACETGRDWQTPVGSYFTAKPLGSKGQVAFLYPGAFGAHVGLGRNLFKLFPELHENSTIKSIAQRLSKIEARLYPRSQSKLSARELEKIEQSLMDDILTLLEAETGIASLITAILRDYFQIQPGAVFGYSLGEITMMYAQGVWGDFSRGSQNLHASSLFSTGISGPMNAVRSAWGLPEVHQAEAHQAGQAAHPEAGTELWNNYILIADPTDVIRCLQQEKQVYLTQINSAKEVVIGGDPQACQRLISALECDAIRAPFNYAIHCPVIQSEYNELLRLNTLPVQTKPGIRCYSAATYAPIPLESEQIGHHLAQTLSQQLDFPRLLERIYNDGSKIFIEVGAGGMCSRWISEALKQKEYVTVSMHRRGIDDHTSIVKAMAKLVSHRVPLDLSPLYAKDAKALQPEAQPAAAAQAVQPALDKSVKQSENQADKHKTLATEPLQPRSHSQNQHQQRQQHQQFQELCHNTSNQAKNHAKFLEDRRRALLQIGHIIQLQTDISEQLCKTLPLEPQDLPRSKISAQSKTSVQSKTPVQSQASTR
jgi:PfaB family protein